MSAFSQESNFSHRNTYSERLSQIGTHEEEFKVSSGKT